MPSGLQRPPPPWPQYTAVGPGPQLSVLAQRMLETRHDAPPLPSLNRLDQVTSKISRTDGHEGELLVPVVDPNS
eukprot:6956280-Pyramimonas_sp.AAC.1